MAELQLLKRKSYLESLYLQNLPVRIPQSVLDKIQQLFMKLIWQYNRPKIRLATLQLRSGKGGLAIPNITFYYHAALLTAMFWW